MTTSLGEVAGKALVVATGGLSIPALGASDIGYRIAEQFGLRVTPTRPGLAPFLLAREDGALAASLSPMAAAVTKRQIYAELMSDDVGASVEDSKRCIEFMMKTADFKEGARALQQGKAPRTAAGSRDGAPHFSRFLGRVPTLTPTSPSRLSPWNLVAVTG